MAPARPGPYDRGMRPLHRSRLPLVAAAALLATSLLVGACGDDAPPLATPTVEVAVPTRSATSTIEGTPPPVEPTASTGALPREQLPLIEFVRADGLTVALPTEVPPRSDYGTGLSGRYTLGERGMLFHYPDDATARGFYMRNTHIDLDIAFARADFEVIEIRTMQAESLEIVRPEQGFQYAVEAPAGWYAEHGVAAGDRIRLTFELPAE